MKICRFGDMLAEKWKISYNKRNLKKGFSYQEKEKDGNYKIQKLKYEYVKYDDNGQPCESYTAVKDVDFDVKRRTIYFNFGA